MSLSDLDLQRWMAALVALPSDPDYLIDWVQGPLRHFFPFRRLFAAYGELVAGQISITHWRAYGHDERYLHQLQATFDIARRGSLDWWRTTKTPLFIDPIKPPPYATDFELKEIEEFGLINVAAHGVVNIKANAGTYFSFAGLPPAATDWIADALQLMTPTLNERFVALFSKNEVVLTFEHLTARQKDIVRLLVSGIDNKSIARTLKISEKTVRNSLVSVYTKLGINGRSRLIAEYR